MLKNIRNTITRLPMDRLGRNLGGRIPSCSRHVRHVANSALDILQLWASGGRTRELILMKFGTQQQVSTAMTVTWSNIKIFKIFKMADSRHVRKYSKCHNSPNSGPTVTQLGWSHPIMFSTCPPCYGYHGNDRCLAPVHCTFSGYGRLETEHVNLFRWNLVHNSTLGPEWQSRDQIFKIFKI